MNKNVYGYCPKCGAPGISRERCPNGTYELCQCGEKVYLYIDAPITDVRMTAYNSSKEIVD